MKKIYNYRIFLKIVIIIVLIYILYTLKNFFIWNIELFNTTEDFIIQSDGNGYEWFGYKIKHILDYSFSDKNIVIDLENKYKPDLIIKSPWGNREYDCPYICCSGESYRAPHNYYPPLCEINTISVNDTNVKSFYVPYGLWSEYNYEKIQNRDTLDNINSKIYDFVYVSKHCIKLRDDLFRNIKLLYEKNDNNNIDKIRSLGPCQNTHNFENDNKGLMENDKIYKDYKFVFCAENSDVDGYITEKIFLGFLSKSIPIYYGTKRIKDIFNDKSFFYINDYLDDNKTLEDIALILKNLAADDSDNGWKKYLREPIFHNNIEPEICKVLQPPLSTYAKEIGDYIRNNYNYIKK